MKAFILLADRFEDIEMIAPLDIMRRAAIEVKMLAIGDDLSVKSAHDVVMRCDGLLKDHIGESPDVVITPGGMPGSTYLSESDLVKKLLKRQADEGRYIASICASPIALESADALQGRKFTCYPSFETQIKSGLHHNQRLVVDGKLITAMGPGVALQFGLKIVELILSASTAEQISQAMII